MDRRKFLAAAATVSLAGCTASGERTKAMSSFQQGPSIGLEPVAEGFYEPLDFQTARDDQLMYVADKYGQVFVRDETGLREEPFLDISSQLTDIPTWEQGLLGFELHPDFESNGRCYVRYSSPSREGTPDNFSHTFVLSEFRAEDDLRRVDPDSERTILEIPEPGEDHNSGAIEFGPDGYLYVGVGEGDALRWWSGSGDVGNADDWYWLTASGNGQDVTENLLGSILRIDVDSRMDGKAYGIPDDNPLVGKEGLDEQYAWGFRNPYRMSFSGDDLYVGDVGSHTAEEVNVVRKAGNYGWAVREGSKCYNDRLAVEALAKLPWFESLLPVCPEETPTGEPLIDPVVAYPHERNGQPFGRAVVGGFLYQNETIPALRDKYVFGDLMGAGSGIYAATPSENGKWPMAGLQVTADANMQSRAILSFGRDSSGELYVLTTLFAEGTGAVHRIVPSDS